MRNEQQSGTISPDKPDVLFLAHQESVKVFLQTPTEQDNKLWILSFHQLVKTPWGITLTLNSTACETNCT